MGTFNGAKQQLRLKGKLKGNMSATLRFTGTEFQSVFISGENDKAFVRTHIRELQSIYSVLTDRRRERGFV